jgi:hypothetical protein
MRNADAQRGKIMIRLRGLQQPFRSHVSHAEIGGCNLSNRHARDLMQSMTRTRSGGGTRFAPRKRYKTKTYLALESGRSGWPALRLAHHEIAEHLHPGHRLQFFGINEVGVELN